MAITVRLEQVSNLRAKHISAWTDLESRALEPNVYLSPHFILPAYRFLTNGAPPIALWIERQAAGSHELIGVGVFAENRPTPLFPLPHLRAFRSRHSYLSGLLLDSAMAAEAVDAWLTHSTSKHFRWHGIEFRDWQADGPTEQLVRSLALKHNIIWHEYANFPRPVLYPRHAGDPYLNAHFSAHRRKGIRRNWRRLNTLGPTTWTMLTEPGEVISRLNHFLKLEHSGWKNNYHSSLLSNPSDHQFFREMATGFASSGRAFFTELRVDERPVASTSNFIANGTGFAFKAGWDQEAAKFSPGILNEFEIIRHAPSLLSRLDFIDSGANVSSYMGQLWRDRRTLTHNILVTTRISRTPLLAFLNVTKQFHQSIADWRNADPCKPKRSLTPPHLDGESTSQA